MVCSIAGKHKEEAPAATTTRSPNKNKEGSKTRQTRENHLPSPKLKQAQLRRDDFTNAEIARAWKAQKKKWDDGFSSGWLDVYLSLDLVVLGEHVGK